MTDDGGIEALRGRIRELEAEVARLRRGVFAADGATVVAPAPFARSFAEAQGVVADYFASFHAEPEGGRIDIGGQRYVLVRAASLSTDFLRTISSLYASRGEAEALRIGQNFLFDVAYVLGGSDARSFHARTGVVDPIARLSTGPVHFAYAGWATVELLPESTPSADDDFFLRYRHPYSFEAHAWAAEGVTASQPVCIMNAGYSSGWCAESFGRPLTAVEITCRARGDAHCEFVMAPPGRIREHLARVSAEARRDAGGLPEIPAFFHRKAVEERLRAARAQSEALVERLAASERTLRAVLDGVDDAILRLDLEGRVVEANQRTAALYGLDAVPPGSPFVGGLGHALEDQDALEVAWARAIGGQPATVVLRQVREPGVVFDAELHLRRVADPDGDFVIAHVRDVTERHRVDRMKDEFVSMVSHELRTPMTSVHGALAMLLGAHRAALPDEAVTLVELAERNTQRLIRLLGDILDLERLSAGRLRIGLEPIALGPVLHDVVETTRSFADAFDVELDLEVDGPCRALADRDRVAQVVHNLLTNAAKFSPPGGLVVLRAFTVGDRVRVTVRDDGPGIPEAFRPRVFEAFSQADTSEARSAYGTGLGLAICKRLVDGMGGTIGFETSAGQGTTFVVELRSA